MANIKAQARYDVKRPKLSYRLRVEQVEDVLAIRANFQSDQAFCDHIFQLGLAAYYENLKIKHIQEID